ncbi:MAG: LytR/AlgR family response regulator transcription factor [Bacteroidota bacterium]
MKKLGSFREIIRTPGGLALLLILALVLSGLLLSVLATGYFETGNLTQGVLAFVLFSVMGLLMVSLIKTSHRLLSSSNTSSEQISPVPEPRSVTDNTKDDTHLFIRVDGKIHKIDFDSINYAEAQGNNVKIVLDDKILLPVMTLTSLEDSLPKNVFARVHRSFIVNTRKITHIEGNRVVIGKSEIPIGSNYREQFLRSIGVNA